MRNEVGCEDGKCPQSILGTVVIDVLLSFNLAATLY
jgi:hypothetical protein